MPDAMVHEWGVDRLIPYAQNPRAHPTEQIAKLCDSIKRFGWTIPILATSAGEVIAGHGRLIAAKQMGLATVPVLLADHMSDEERRAYRLADNRLADMGEWDTASLEAELKALAMDDYDLGSIGFDSEMLMETLAAGPEQADKGATRNALLDAYLEPPLSSSVFFRQRKDTL